MKATFSADILARRLGKYRDLRRMSQKSLAARSGISRKAINVLESGQADDMRVSSLEGVSLGIGATPDALLGYDDLPLVRMAGGPGFAAWNARDFLSPRPCQRCGLEIAARAMHPQGECMMAMSDSGKSAGNIAAVFGLRAAGVECLLADEHDARRRRRF